MAKHVFPNSMVAHVWAQQRSPEDHGRSANGNFYFTGPTLYSYGSHFVVAHFARNEAGAACVLFNEHKYSPSTTRHQGYAKQAVNRDIDKFYVSHPGPGWGVKLYHNDNVRGFRFRIDVLIAKIATTRSRKGDYISELQHTQDHAARYSEFFSLGEDFTIPDMEKMLAEAREAEAAARGREKLRLAQVIIDAQPDIADWIAGVPVQISWEIPTIYMRVKYDGHNQQHIQTSKGAEFPAAHGIKAFAFIAKCRATGKVWERNGHSIALGHFRIDRIGATGDVKAGCHYVEWAEIERIAKLLNVA